MAAASASLVLVACGQRTPVPTLDLATLTPPSAPTGTVDRPAPVPPPASTATPQPAPAPMATPGATAAAPASPRPTTLTAEEAVAKVMPAVVRVEVGDSSTSGVVVGSAGQVITSEGLIGAADGARVQAQDGRWLSAKVLFTDPDRSLVLLETNDPALPSAVLGDPEALRPGDPVVAVGYAPDPRGTPKATRGGFSARRTILGVDHIETDALIDRGNAGGPLVSLRGEVVGINRLSATRRGGEPVPDVNLAVSSAEVRDFLREAAAEAERRARATATPTPTPVTSPTPTARPPTPRPTTPPTRPSDGAPSDGTTFRGKLEGKQGGAFAQYEFTYPGDRSVYTLNLYVRPDDARILRNAGFTVYDPDGRLVVQGGAQPGLRPNVSGNVITTKAGVYLLQVHNYNPDVAIEYEVELVIGPPPGA